MTETPVNPNDERPTLHLPKKKYLTIKEGSLENAVANVMYEKGEVSSVGTPLKHKRSWDTKTHKLIVDPRKGKGVKVVPKHVRGDPAEERGRHRGEEGGRGRAARRAVRVPVPVPRRHHEGELARVDSGGNGAGKKV